MELEKMYKILKLKIFYFSYKKLKILENKSKLGDLDNFF
jgi:hypothetical protein